MKISRKHSLDDAPVAPVKDLPSAMQRAVDENGAQWCRRLGLERFASQICLSATHEQACDSMCRLLLHETTDKHGGSNESALSNYGMGGVALWSLWEHAAASDEWRASIAHHIFMEALTCTDFAPPADRVLAELPRARDTQKASVLARMVEGGHVHLVRVALGARLYQNAVDDTALLSGANGTLDSDTWAEMITVFNKFWQRYQCHQPAQEARTRISAMIARLPYTAVHSAWLASGACGHDTRWPNGPRLRLTKADYLDVEKWTTLVTQGYWFDAMRIAQEMCECANVAELATVTVAHMPWTAGVFLGALSAAGKSTDFLAALVSRWWPLSAEYDCHSPRQIMDQVDFVKGALLDEVIKRPSLLSLFCLKKMDSKQLCAVAKHVNPMLVYSARPSMQPAVFAISMSRKALAKMDAERWIPVWKNVAHVKAMIQGDEVDASHMLEYAVFRRAGYEYAPWAMVQLAKCGYMNVDQLDGDGRLEWFLEHAQLHKNCHALGLYAVDPRVTRYLKDEGKLYTAMVTIAESLVDKAAMLQLLAAGGFVYPIVANGTEVMCRAALEAGYRPPWSMIRPDKVSPDRFLLLVGYMDAPPSPVILYDIARTGHSILIFRALVNKFGAGFLGNDVLAVATVAGNSDLCDLIVKWRGSAVTKLEKTVPVGWSAPLVDESFYL